MHVSTFTCTCGSICLAGPKAWTNQSRSRISSRRSSIMTCLRTPKYTTVPPHVPILDHPRPDRNWSGARVKLRGLRGLRRFQPVFGFRAEAFDFRAKVSTLNPNTKLPGLLQLGCQPGTLTVFGELVSQLVVASRL